MSGQYARDVSIAGCGALPTTRLLSEQVSSSHDLRPTFGHQSRLRSAKARPCPGRPARLSNGWPPCRNDLNAD